MNKAELVEALAVHFDGNKAEAARALKAVVDTVTESMARGEKVSITGFGVFESINRPARMVRNPRTGERKQAAAMNVPKFRAGSDLKSYVSGEKQYVSTAATAGKTGKPVAKAAKPTTKTAAKPTTKTAAKPTTKAAAAPAPAKKPAAATKAASKTTPAKKPAARKPAK